MYGKQTLANSIKTRTITKNNFGMPKYENAKFWPVNKTEAKEDIKKEVVHNYEVDKSNIKPKKLS